MDCFREPPLWRNERELRGKHALRDASYMQQLQDEIMGWYREVLPTEEEREARAAAFMRVEKETQALWPGCSWSDPHGSYATGLYLPYSDVHAYIVCYDRQPTLSDLSSFYMCLRSRYGAFRNIDFRGRAKVPIVAFDDAASGIHFDFQMAHYSDMSSRGCSFRHDFTNTSVAEFPSSLAPLYMVLKAFLQHKGLNEVYRTGGINSFMLLAMLKAVLLLHQDEHEQSRRNATSTASAAAASYSIDEGQVGFLLLAFFHFYGACLDVEQYGVTCRDDGSGRRRRVLPVTELAADRLTVPHRYGELLLGVEDPLGPDRGNDIGKTSFNFRNIRAVFREAYQTLSSSHTAFGLFSRIVPPASTFRRR